MDKFILTSIPIEELIEKIATKISLTKKQAKLDSNENQDELLNREQACKLLSINKTSLWKHTKSGRFKSYGIGNRVLYKKSELLDSLKPLNH